MSVFIGWILISTAACAPARRAVRAPFPDTALFPCTSPVATKSGLLQGGVDEWGETCSWKGIPYAAPPVGDLRWKAPRPPVSWEGLRDASDWGDVCLQGFLMKWGHSIPAGMSEDCLSLNIWRPREQGTFPVMVWFHGGAYFCGASSSPMYIGDRLSANGRVVVVTVNYRLAAFGFLFHEELAREDPNGSAGNYGTLDQIAALKWVRENIAAFGGDPDNVTIFGQSAGGWSICALVATPLARGLFHKAIIESGGCQGFMPRDRAVENGNWAARTLGCADHDISCMRKKRARKILRKLSPPPVRSLAGKGSRYLNHVDGYVFSDTSLSMLQSGKFNNVPLIAGSTLEEIPPKALGIAEKFMGNYEEAIRKMFPDHADRLLELYSLERYDDAAHAISALLSDRILICPTWEGMRAVAGRQPRTYYYRFDYNKTIMGALHLIEIPYVFENFDRKPVSWFFQMVDMDVPYEIGRVIQQYWTNFAWRGDPNGKGLPPWPPFRAADPKVLVFDSDIRAEAPDLFERCEFWAGYYRTHPLILEMEW